MKRCDWCESDDLYIKYHDEEWGVPVHEDRKHFEFLVLESAQAGLSWLTILKKREHYRKAYDNFNPALIARYDDEKIEELIKNKGIVRNRKKIEASIINAKRFLDIRHEFESFDRYIWRFVDNKPVINSYQSISEIPASSELSEKISKDLKKNADLNSLDRLLYIRSCRPRVSLMIILTHVLENKEKETAMIISASRRTDIPAFYADWFFARLQEGYVHVRNPMNPRQVSQISLLPEVVDGIVFWTKNPAPMMDRLDMLERYTYYFQFTLTAYQRDVEPNVPSKNDILIPAFEALSKQIGRERVIWRYDPILFNGKYTMDYHVKYFSQLVSKLAGYTEKCTVSFLNFYRKTRKNAAQLGLFDPPAAQKEELLQQFAAMAERAGIYIDTCAEEPDYSRYGIARAACIDKDRLERLGGHGLIYLDKDKNQRAECLCAESVDIGAYNTCRHGCLYCYANIDAGAARKNAGTHDPSAPLLFGKRRDSDTLKIRDVKSCRVNQLSLFD